jgi:hypothetical protein
MAHELEPGRKLARHRGGFLEGEAGLVPRATEGLSGGGHDEHDEGHAARQAHGRARLSLQAVGHAFTRLALLTARSKARARARAFRKSCAPAHPAGAPHERARACPRTKARDFR